MSQELDREQVNAFFNELDEDKSGEITIAELGKTLKEKFELAMSAEELQQQLNEIDKNGSGTIDANELYDFLAKL